MESDLGSQPFHPWQRWEHFEGLGLIPMERGVGIDILDWMATQMMPVFIADCHGASWATECAELAYKAADALLAERAKRETAAETEQTAG